GRHSLPAATVFGSLLQPAVRMHRDESAVWRAPGRTARRPRAVRIDARRVLAPCDVVIFRSDVVAGFRARDLKARRPAPQALQRADRMHVLSVPRSAAGKTRRGVSLS